MKNLHKHLTSITKTSGEFRPILQGVRYDAESQYIVATDSHRLIRVKPSEKIETSMTINPLTMQLINGNYPDTSRLIPNCDEPTFTITKEWFTKENLSLFKQPKKIAIKFVTNDDILSLLTFNFKSENHVDAKHLENIPLTHSIENDGIVIDTKYLLDALNLFKDTKQNVNVIYNGKHKPVLLETVDKHYLYLITPIRCL